MEHWGTLALMLVQGEVCSLRMARCFPKQRKSVIIFKSHLVYHFALILMKDLCAKPDQMLYICQKTQLSLQGYHQKIDKFHE